MAYGKKTGGRQPGTPNRLSGQLKTWIQSLVEKNKAAFEKDLKALEPKDRLLVLEKLLGYVVPRLSSVSIEEMVRTEYEQLEKLLNSAPDEAIDEIYEKIKNLKENGKGSKN